MLYTVRGSGRLRAEGGETELRAGYGTVINCRHPHSYEAVTGEWEFYWIHFNGAGAASLHNALAAYGVRAAEVGDTAAFELLIRRIMDSMRINDVMNSLQISSDLHRLYLVLCRSAADAADAESRRAYSAMIDTVTDYIKDNYSKNITIDDMVRRAHLSKYHFIRIFKRVMGTTPYSYLTNYRINTAKRMLRLTDKPVAEIALDCGYTDTSNFISHFKKHVGMKPAQYRRDYI